MNKNIKKSRSKTVLKINRGQPYLFLDDSGLDIADNLTFRINPPRKEGIVLAPEREWEAYRISPIAVLEDGNIYKMWYTSIATTPGSSNFLICSRCKKENPGTKVVCIFCGWPLLDIDYFQNELIGICYAESKDGICWERPDLELVEFHGNKRNNMIAGPCGVPAINPKADPSERFMGIVEYQQQQYLTVSPDGLKWTRKKRPCLPFCADTTNQIIYNKDKDNYIALLRGFPGRRTTVLCEINNLNQYPWPYTENQHETDDMGIRYITDELPTVLDIDANDPKLPGLDINHISAHYYAPETWFGFPALFRKYPPAGMDRIQREQHRFFAQGNDGTWETQLAVSRDGVHWSRPDRSAYLKPGLYGYPDGGLNGIGIGMINRGDEIFQYGYGSRTTHGIFEPGEQKGDGSIYRFVQLRDRFIAVTAGPKGGRLLTHPFPLPEGILVLNIDCGGLGEASIELRDVNGIPIPGFIHDDCDRVDLNHLSHMVTWRGKTTNSLKAGQTVQLDIRMHSTSLYALSFLNY